jgi:hypothetical protein
MPIWLRNFTFNEMKIYYEEEKARSEGKNPNKNNPWLDPNSPEALKARENKSITTPNFVNKSPTYNTTLKNKALKK